MRPLGQGKLICRLVLIKKISHTSSKTTARVFVVQTMKKEQRDAPREGEVSVVSTMHSKYGMQTLNCQSLPVELWHLVNLRDF